MMMVDLLKLILGLLASLFKSRANFEAEVLIPRQQINVLRRRMPNRPLSMLKNLFDLRLRFPVTIVSDDCLSAA
jgi:hypothetical protein